MPIVDDMARQLQIQIYALWYNILLSLAGIQWSAERAVIMMGYTIELMNTWLVNNAFTPLIAQTNASLQVAVTAAFAIAMLCTGDHLSSGGLCACSRRGSTQRHRLVSGGSALLCAWAATLSGNERLSPRRLASLLRQRAEGITGRNRFLV